MVKYRINILNMDSITDFVRIRGKRTGEIRDVYFVKFVGANNSTYEDIRKLKKALSEEQALGRIYFKYIDTLNIESDCNEYKEAYDRFIFSEKKHIDLKIIKTGKLNEDQLIYAVNEMMRLLYIYKQNLSESIIKNIIVKLLYWLEKKFLCENIKIDGDKNIKIICENVVKESGVYFLAFLNLLGTDICMLQTNADSDIMKEYIHTKILGKFCKEEGIWSKLTEEEISHPKKTVRDDIIFNNSKSVSESGSPVIISMESTRRKDRDKKEGQAGFVEAKNNTNNICQSSQKDSNGVSNNSFIAAGRKRERELSYMELAKLSVSVVMITKYDMSKKTAGTGSGIMIGKDGFILTNCHVISGGDLFEIRIEDDDMTYKTTEVVKYNQYLDLAVIRIPRVLTPLRLYTGSETLVRGQSVVAIGSPLGLFNSVSDGIISGFRNIENVDMIQFSAPISPGSSGGAVLNMYGEVIGISTAGFDEGQNINLAVPYEAIRDFARGFIR